MSMLMSPSYFRFTPTGSAWNAVGLRIPVSSDPAYNSLSRLSLYSPDFQELLVAGQPNYAKVNWLAMDKNHADWNFFGLKAEIQPFKSYNVLEHEGGLHTLALGANPGISWGSSDVCKIWDLELSPGFYRISLSNSYMADFGIGLCSSQGDTQNYITPATLMAFQDRTGLSTGESFIVEISQTDVYGFIAWSNNTFSGTISISIADPGYWTGALDTNWHNPGNWQPVLSRTRMLISPFREL
ncbi:MAG: hypothetical protein LRZ88_07850 [Candidatus Cloacimonetes bacterium]|nr:hypothetical protein [Candidatus Cloacimonadota bacterium]